jgi:hypothetical protein
MLGDTPSSTPRPAHFGATPYDLTGVRPGLAIEAGSDTMPGLAGGPGLLQENPPPWHPASPLFWFGVLAATTLGLIAASTTVRVGPFTASASAGTS